MINAIIKGIFFLITSLFNALLTPFINILTTLFPSLDSYFGYISSFFGYACTYIRSILSLLCIPDTLIVGLFDYFLISYSIYVTFLAIRFAINVYNKLKI